MTALFWEEGPLGKQHDRTAFDCGEIKLNTYLKRYARQNHESGGAKCFIATPCGEPPPHSRFLHAEPCVD